MPRPFFKTAPRDSALQHAAAAQPVSLSRRVLLALGAMASAAAAGVARSAAAAPSAAGSTAGSTPATSTWAARAIAAPEPLQQIRAGGPSGLLGVGASGALWALSPSGAAATRLGEGLDPLTPLAVGSGRIAARLADGGLWVWQAGRAERSAAGTLAPLAGLLVLPLAVIGVAADGQQLIRLEPGVGGAAGATSATNGNSAGAVWAEVARSAQAVLPDARPVQADLDGRGDGGHLAVLAGPDAQRYRHGVLGDATEATRVLWLERHSLQLLREMVLPAPHVIEDIALRPVAMGAAGGAAALLTVRSGPQGGQLGLISASVNQPGQLHWAALGDALGIPNRWMSPTTDGQRVLAVHTPHIGGVLHDYRLQGGRLVGRVVGRGVSTHRLGSRELDLAVWLGAHLLLPEQDGRALRVLAADLDWAQQASLALTGRVAMTAALPNGRSMAALLDDGQVVRVKRS